MTTMERGANVLRSVDFDRPPVVETLIGLQFAPIKNWSVLHLGLFWNAVREDYKRYEIHSPVSSGFELRLGSSGPEAPSVQFQTEVPLRAWFFDPSETRLIQIQNNAFIHNWRKTEATQKYQHYDVIRPIFEKEWLRFLSFLRDNELSEPQVWQCEVCYINHIAKGEGWESFSDLPNVLSLWSGERSTDFLPSPEVASMTAAFPMPRSLGHLHVAASPAVRQSDSKEIIQLTLTARGKPASSRLEDICAWLDVGHDWIVHGFKSITTIQMHQLWGIR